MSEENDKNKYVTEEHVDKRFDEQKKYLDERISEQTQVILSSLDSILEKRFTEMKEDLRIDINNVQTIIDGYVKAQEDFKQEFIVMKEEISQIKKVLKEKLGLEIGAMI